MSRYSALAADRPRFLIQTGVPPEELARYLPVFGAMVDANPGHLEPDAALDDQLLFIWLYTRMRVPQSVLAATFGLSPRQVAAWVERLKPVFQLAVGSLSTTALPERDLAVLRRINARGVRYLVVGGQAVAHHGYLRPILDLDLFVATDALNAGRLRLALNDLAPGVDPRVSDVLQLSERVIRLGSPPYTIAPFEPNSRFIGVGQPPATIEILTAISAVTFDQCEPRSVRGVLGDVTVPIIGLDHLKLNKRASIRIKDSDDLMHLA